MLGRKRQNVPERSGQIMEYYGPSSQPTELPSVETQADRYFIAHDDWQALQSNHLNLRRGDLVKVLNMAAKGTYASAKPTLRVYWLTSA